MHNFGYIAETIEPLPNTKGVNKFGRPKFMTPLEIQEMLQESAFGKKKKRRKKTKAQKQAAKAMKLHWKENISLKKAWARVKRQS